MIFYNPIYFKNNLDKPIFKLSIPKAFFNNKSIFINCKNSDIEVHFTLALRQTSDGLDY